MLQISTGMYFDGGPVHETLHRAVFYTNAAALRPDPVDVPFGRLLFASGVAPITAVTIEDMRSAGHPCPRGVRRAP